MNRLWSGIPPRAFLWFTICLVTFSQQVIAEQGTRRALLIGVNQYSNLPNLKGSLNDVAAIRELLVNRYGFREENVVKLTNTQATRAGILQALEDIVESSGPNDTVYLHYSGHGSQVRDMNGDEADGMDETICPHDARSEGISDITDDELDSIISNFRVGSVVMVLDSCHSGTGLRGALFDIRQRSVPPDERLELYSNQSKGVATRAVVALPASEKYLLFTGAAANQSALDGPFANGRYNGLFTYAFSNALAVLPKDASSREVMLEVGQQIDKLRSRLGGFPLPEPQLEGPQEYLDQPLLGLRAAAQGTANKVVARLPWVVAKKDDSGNLLLLGGDKMGAHPGSIWAIYPDGETEFLPGNALASLEVDRLSGSDAVARIIGNIEAVRLPARSRAVLMQPAPVLEYLALLLHQVGQPLRGKLESQLPQIFGEFVKLVEPGRVADAVLDCKSLDGGSRWRCMLEGAGNGVRRVEVTAGAGQMAEQLARHLWRPVLVASLQSTENSSSLMQLDFKVHGNKAGTPISIGDRGIRVTANTAPNKLRFYRSETTRTSQNSLQLEFATNQDCYLTVVEFDSQGKLGQLFPNAYQKAGFYPKGKISAGEKILIPDSMKDENRAGFHLDYGPPAGKGTLQAFCMQDPRDAELLRSRIASVNSESAGITALDTRSALSGLRRDLSKFATRGIRRLNDQQPVGIKTAVTGQGVSPSDWAASSLTLEISE